MEKRIILDNAGNVYNFDGKKMEIIGKSEELKVYGDGVETVGNDIFFKDNNEEYTLLAENSRRIEFNEEELESQFYFSSKGVLFFKEDEKTMPEKISKCYAKYLPILQNPPQKLHENAFVALNSCTGKAQVFKKNKDEMPIPYPDAGEAYAITSGPEICIAWNGMGFVLTKNGLMKLSLSLLYQGCSYILFSCGAFAFALHLNKPEISVFARPVKVEITTESDLFITKDNEGQQLYHLTDDGIKHIGTALGDLEISKDGTIKDTLIKSSGGTAFPNLPKETRISIYDLENGEYVQKK